MSTIEQYVLRKLQERNTAGNLRQLPHANGGIDFFSNDYLGFATTGRLQAMVDERFTTAGTTGSTGSRLLSGNAPLTEALEARIAKFHNSPAALLFNSGYDANIGLFSALGGKDTIVLYDALCHASIIDGIRLGLAQRFKFRHNDLDDLEIQLKKYAGKGPLLVAIESVYSMDGDLAPLAEICELCNNFGASLIVDEAHATGVFGPRGAGLVSALGLEQRVFARIHTYGKALGTHGAAILGSEQLKSFLINFARSFIFTTALPGQSVQAIDAAYCCLEATGFTNEPLHTLIRHFVTMINGTVAKQHYIPSISPIKIIITGSNDSAKQMAAKIVDAGMTVKPILHPTVPLGSERIRICLHQFNTIEQLVQLSRIISQI